MGFMDIRSSCVVSNILVVHWLDAKEELAVQDAFITWSSLYIWFSLSIFLYLNQTIGVS